jgi:hypothetical protein
MKNMKIIIRSHGGLGNQIFQIFYAIMVRNRLPDSEIIIYHDNRYDHRFELSSIFADRFQIKSISDASFIVRFRLVKFLEKLKINSGILISKNIVYLDGYFNNCSALKNFETFEVSLALKELRNIIGTSKKEKEVVLYHLRLGDFFSSEKEKKDFLLTKISSIKVHSHVVTNEESFVEDPLLKKIIISKNLKLISTKNMTDHKVLDIMGEYNLINTNGSTLAFWAAVLNKKKLEINHKILNDLYRFLKK